MPFYEQPTTKKPMITMNELFQEWKKKNERRMKELNVKPRVFEYVSKPMVVQQR